MGKHNRLKLWGLQIYFYLKFELWKGQKCRWNDQIHKEIEYSQLSLSKNKMSAVFMIWGTSGNVHDP